MQWHCHGKQTLLPGSIRSLWLLLSFQPSSAMISEPPVEGMWYQRSHWELSMPQSLVLYVLTNYRYWLPYATKRHSLMKARKHSSRSLGENQITTILVNQVTNKVSHILILTIPLFCWKKSPLYKMSLPKCIMPVVEISTTCFSKNIQRVFLNSIYMRRNLARVRGQYKSFCYLYFCASYFEL